MEQGRAPGHEEETDEPTDEGEPAGDGAHANPVEQLLPAVMKAVPALMLLGLSTLIAALGLGIWGADLIGDAIGQGVASGGADEFKDAQVLAAWLPSLESLGLGLILFAISVTLLAIATRLRTMTHELVGRVGEHGPDEEAPATDR